MHLPTYFSLSNLRIINFIFITSNGGVTRSFECTRCDLCCTPPPLFLLLLIFHGVLNKIKRVVVLLLRIRSQERKR